MSRSFLEKLRNPDEEFLSYIRMLSHMIPLGLGFMATFIFLIGLIAVAAMGKTSLLLPVVLRLGVFLMYLIAGLIAMSIVVFLGLKIYVSAKLKKKCQ